MKCCKYVLMRFSVATYKGTVTKTEYKNDAVSGS